MYFLKKSSIRAWIRASRPAANVNLVFPLIFGQALALKGVGQFEWKVFGLVLLYGWFAEMYIVLWNDWADREADLLNGDYTIFSGGSRVLPDGLISAQALLVAGWVNFALVLSVAGVFWWGLGRVYMPVLALAGLALLWLYSMPPVRLNYRGGGEMLQGLGCGVLLPVTGYYAQARGVVGLPWHLLLPLFCFYFINSVATSLPDRRGDSLAGKNTLAVVLGAKRAGGIAVLVGLAGVLAAGFGAAGLAGIVLWLGVVVPAGLLIGCAAVLPRLESGGKYMVFFIVNIILVGMSYSIGFSLAYFLAW